MGRATGCGAHRAALAAFAERSERDASTAAAFDHLERCRRCQADVTETLLTVHAIRRTLAEARSVDAPPDAWVRLRRRVQRPAAGLWAARASLAGVLVGAGLVAALIGPTAVIRPRDAIEREPGPPWAVLWAQTVADQRAETAFLSRMSRTRAEPPPDRVVSEIVPVTNWAGPDGLGRTSPSVHIEVPPARAD
jgi:hypothetical protein